MRYYLCGLLFFFIFNCAASQIDSVPVETKPDPPEVEKQTAEPINGFPIGVGDELKITVWKNDDLNRTIRVSPSGTIFYPLVGEIQVAGHGTEDVRKRIAQGLSTYLISPQVNVDISTFRSRKVYVLGEVIRPRRLVIEDNINIMDALTMAGGVSIHANMEKVILVRSSPSEMQIQSLNLEDLIRKGDASQMAYLQSGDIVFVPPSQIEEVARFFDYVRRIFRGILEVQRTIILGDEIYDIIQNEDDVTTRRIIIEADDDFPFPQ
jgi:polysaccharide export outer membrane protein